MARVERRRHVAVLPFVTAPSYGVRRWYCLPSLVEVSARELQAIAVSAAATRTGRAQGRR